MTVKDVLSRSAFAAAESGKIPDTAIRTGMRTLLRERLRSLADQPPLDEATLSTGPIAPAPREANGQHREVPAAFFELVLGPWNKYSSCLWPDGNSDFTLADAELAMLKLTCSRAKLADGQDVLDLGCGWGALTLFAAEYYPDSRIVAVSHSASQRLHIEERARQRGLRNVRVITGGHLRPRIRARDVRPRGFGRDVRAHEQL